MSPFRYLAIPFALAVPSLAAAQPMPQPLQTMPQPTPDADALAAAIRTLGANPRDLTALITAGELSLKLGDATAAAALFKRADEIDPMNGRVKAGMARILVQQERPGEALRYFDQAAGYGLDVRTFAGDRGLAYDLIGEQERAQRDYRLALEGGVQDEVQRRYALSLGISGKREPALTEIDALLRRSDRGAWRARAFILAMSGDVPGAGVIATRMMPPGMAAGLQPFFEKLAALAPIDRAFAVHFGETRPTPQRLADARMAPPLPVLAPEPRSATMLAATDTKPAPQAKRDRRREREAAQEARERRRGKPDKVEVAAAAPVTAPALPPPPGYAGSGVAFAAPRAVVQAVPRTSEPAATATAPVKLARNDVAMPSPTSRPVAPATTQPARSVVQSTTPAISNVGLTRPASSSPPKSVVVPPASASVTPLTPDAPTLAARAPAPSPGFSTMMPETPSLAKAPAGAEVASVAPATVAVVPAPATPIATPPVAANVALSPAPSATMSGGAAPTPPPPAVLPPAATLPAMTAAVGAAPSTTAPSRLSEDDILARIIAGISIPSSELGVAPVRPTPMPVASPPPAPGTSVATPASIAAAETARRSAETHRQRTAEVAAEKPAPPPGARRGTADADRTTRTAGKTATEAKPVDPKIAAKKALADRKATADKKLAEAKKAADAKQAAEEKTAAKADPPRIWVQVAGGANESDLPKAWAGVKGKAAALGGRAAYSTPLRATNRVVTGPFKTDAEARAFVNSLAKQGVSAFPFTSEKGQKMTKLPPK